MDGRSVGSSNLLSIGLRYSLSGSPESAAESPQNFIPFHIFRMEILKAHLDHERPPLSTIISLCLILFRPTLPTLAISQTVGFRQSKTALFDWLLLVLLVVSRVDFNFFVLFLETIGVREYCCMAAGTGAFFNIGARSVVGSSRFF